MIPDDPAIRDKLRALSRTGSPYSRTAAQKMLDGERPTRAEVSALMQYVTRGNNPRRRKKTNAEYSSAND